MIVWILTACVFLMSNNGEKCKYSCTFLWNNLTCKGVNIHILLSLRWRHNDHDSASNHQPRGCLLNRLFRRKSKKTSKLRVTDLCAGEFPAQRASCAENVSIWWRHHVYNHLACKGLTWQISEWLDFERSGDNTICYLIIKWAPACIQASCHYLREFYATVPV